MMALSDSDEEIDPTPPPSYSAAVSQAVEQRISLVEEEVEEIRATETVPLTSSSVPVEAFSGDGENNGNGSAAPTDNLYDYPE